MSQIATDDANHIHTVRLSPVGVELMRASTFDAEVRRPEGELSLGGASDRAMAANAARWVAEELGDLSGCTGALWVDLVEAPVEDGSHAIGDGELQSAVEAALWRPRLHVLTLLANSALSKQFPRTLAQIDRALASMQKYWTLEIWHPTASNVSHLQHWPFHGFSALLKRRLTPRKSGVQWGNVHRLSFMYLDPVQLDTAFLLDSTAMRHMLGDQSQVRELAIYFNLPDLNDAIRAFLPVVWGYFNGANEHRLMRLMVHTVTHLTYLAMAHVDPWGRRFVEANPQHDEVIYPVVVAHYHPAQSMITAAQRSAMLDHLEVVLPRVRAATLRMPWCLCEIAGEDECRDIHRQAAMRLRTLLQESPLLSRLRIDHFQPLAPAGPPGFGYERSVPWYGRALADAAPLAELRALSIRTHVSDAERGEHLVQILRKQTFLSVMMIYLHDNVVFGDGVSSPGATCVIPDVLDGPIPSVLKTCLRTRYEPLINAVRLSWIPRVFVRTHLTPHFDESVPRHVRKRRRAAASAMERELAGIFAILKTERVVSRFSDSGIFRHPRLPKEFVIESNTERLFPALSMASSDHGGFAHFMASK